MASVFAPSKGGGLIQKITGLSDLGVVVVVVMIVLMMVLPIPRPFWTFVGGRVASPLAPAVDDEYP